MYVIYFIPLTCAARVAGLLCSLWCVNHPLIIPTISEAGAGAAVSPAPAWPRDDTKLPCFMGLPKLRQKIFVLMKLLRFLSGYFLKVFNDIVFLGEPEVNWKQRRIFPPHILAAGAGGVWCCYRGSSLLFRNAPLPPAPAQRRGAATGHWTAIMFPRPSWVQARGGALVRVSSRGVNKPSRSFTVPWAGEGSY